MGGTGSIRSMQWGHHCHQSRQQKLEVHHIGGYGQVNPLRTHSFMHRQPRYSARSSAWPAVLGNKQSLTNSLLQPAPSTAASKDAAQEGIVGMSKARRKRHRRQTPCCSSTFADADVQVSNLAGLPASQPCSGPLQSVESFPCLHQALGPA